MRKTTNDILGQKGQTPIVCLTAYTAPMATALDNATDLLLVGDSLSMVLYGMDSTRGATLDMMNYHGKSVVQATQETCVIIDMPYGSYEESPDLALENAKKIIDYTKAQGIKLEGGQEMADTVEKLVSHNIPVMGHVGLRPQSVDGPEGYRVQGKDKHSAQQVLDDAKAISTAGAFSIVLEAIPEDLATVITNDITAPTIGIGASASCDGQILVSEDMLGLTPGRKPKFVREYADLQANIQSAAESYANDVRARQFPSSEFTYKKAS